MFSNKAILEAVERFDIDKAREMLRQNVREESAKAGGKQGRVKILERVVKENSPSRRNMSGAMIQESGRYAFCDGVRVFMSDNPEGFDVIEKGIGANVESIFASYKTSDTIVFDKADLKTFINVNGYKRNSRKNTAYIAKTESGSYIGFNPFFLMDLLDYTGETRFECGSPKNPIVTKDAMLCPVIVGIKTDEEYEVWRKNYNIA